MALLILCALMLFFVMGAVCSVDDTVILEKSSESSVVSDNVNLDNSNQTVLNNKSSSDDSNGNDNEAKKIQNASFSKVSKANYIRGDYFYVDLLDDNATGIANKTVCFTVNNKSYNRNTNENGTAGLKISLKKGFYALKYSFKESGYNKTKASKKILVLSKPVSTISGCNMNSYAGIKSPFNVTLKANGIPLPNRKVKFVVNKKEYYRKTNSDGVATLNICLAKGTYKIKYGFAGEENIKSSNSNSQINLKLLKNPYGTKYRHVYIDADGGFTKSFLKEIASKLRKAGWKVTVYGIGPGQHSINYKKVKNGVYMPFYNGLCAATIKEMAAKYYGGVIKKHKSVLAPSWYNGYNSSRLLTKNDNDITKIKYLNRSWDDNFSPKSFKGLANPAEYMTKNKIKYTVGVTTYQVVEQFLYGGWVAHH